MFEQHHLGNKGPSFLTCNPEQVYVAILDSEPPNLLSPNHEISRNVLSMVSVRLQM